jgi:hypothetical protein
MGGMHNFWEIPIKFLSLPLYVGACTICIHQELLNYAINLFLAGIPQIHHGY